MSRAVGIKRDLRLSRLETYANYYYLNFRSYLGLHGDSYDRFLIRMNEMAETTNIMTQCIYKLYKYNQTKEYSGKNTYLIPHQLLAFCTKNKLTSQNKNKYNNMEEVINHFKYWSEGLVPLPGMTYQAIESPKGEFGVTLVSDGTNKPYRCKIKSPALQHIQLVPEIAKGHFLADLAAIVGTIDIVFGEIDR